MEDSSEGQHAVNLIGFSGETLLDKLDDEPTLRSAPLARGLTDPFVERTGKRDVLPHVRYHATIIHIKIGVLHTFGPGPPGHVDRRASCNVAMNPGRRTGADPDSRFRLRACPYEEIAATWI